MHSRWIICIWLAAKPPMKGSWGASLGILHPGPQPQLLLSPGRPWASAWVLVLLRLHVPQSRVCTNSFALPQPSTIYRKALGKKWSWCFVITMWLKTIWNMTTVNTNPQPSKLMSSFCKASILYPAPQLLMGAHSFRISTPDTLAPGALCGRTLPALDCQPCLLPTTAQPALSTTLSLWGAPELAHSRVDYSWDKRRGFWLPVCLNIV